MSGTPPTRPLEAVLPFNDPQRDFAWFEHAVRDLLMLVGFENVGFYGVPGNGQEGIDIRGDFDSRHHGIQAKKREDFGDADVEAAVLAATYKADRFILALSRRATVGVINAIDRHKDKWSLWDQVRLSDLVRGLPLAIAVDYIERHFHPAHVETFLGRGRATTFVERDVYFAPFSDASSLRYQGWQRVGPAAPLDSLIAFVRDDAARVAIVSGPIGIGKSKLVYDLTAEEDHMNGRQAYFLSRGSPVTLEGLREIRAGDNLVVIDGSQDIVEFPALMGNLVRRPECKVIVTVSSVALTRVNDAIVLAGYPSPSLHPVPLNRLGRDATIALTQQVLGYEDARAEEAVVQFASDSPLTTTLTARVLRDRRATPDALESERHVRDLIRAMHRDVAIGNVSEVIPRADVRSVLQVLALTGPAHIMDDGWLDSATAFLGWERDRLLHTLDAIDLAGVLLRRGSTYCVAPDILRQSIAFEACVAHGQATTMPTRLYEHFPPEGQLLRNVALVDLESIASGGPAIFDSLWSLVDAAARAAHSLDRAHLLDHLEDVAYLKPRDVFGLVAYLVDHPAANDDTQPLADMYTIGHDTVMREIPDVLRAVMLVSREHVRPSFQLLWDLGKDGAPWATSDPIRTIRDMASYDIGVPTTAAEEIVAEVASMIDMGVADSPRASLLDLIAPVLARDLDSHLTRGSRLLFERAVLNVQSVQALRDRAIAIVCSAALGDNDRRADKAIGLLAGLFREPMNQFVDPSAETTAAWNREREMAFDAFDTIIASGSWPVRELRIAQLVPFYATYSPSDVVRSRGNAVLAKLARTPDRDRFRILIPELLGFVEFVDVRADPDPAATGERRCGEFIDATTREILSERDDDLLLSDIVQRVAAIEAAGVVASPRALFAAIANAEPMRARSLIDAILARADSSLLGSMDPLLRFALATDLASGAALARRMLDLGNVDAKLAVASGLAIAVEPSQRDSQVRSAFLREALRDENNAVRMTAANTLGFFRRTYPDLAAALVLYAEVGNDSTLAERLYMWLPTDTSTLDDNTIEALITKLREVLQLDYWPLDFLKRVASTHSRLVFDLFAWRIESGPDASSYHAVPYADVTFRHTIEALSHSSTFGADVQALLASYATLPPSRRFTFSILVGHIAKVAPSLVMSAIEEAMQSGDTERQRAAISWLRSLPHATVAADAAGITRIVERACAVGAELSRAVYGAVLNALISGAEAVGMYQQAPRDVRVQAFAIAALATELSADARRFFTLLNDYGRRSGERSVLHAEEVFGPE